MIIEIAESCGFCFGVKRAIEMAEENKNSVTFGPLIHNPLEIERLKEIYNVGLVENIDELKSNQKVIIRTHGIIKQDLEKLQKKGIETIDATCPFVTKPQEIVKEMSEKGYDIVIFGDKNHPEVKGVASYSKTDRVFTILETDELKNIKLKDKIALVAQTTRKVSEFLKISNYLIERHKEVRVFNTICNATFENQEAVRKLAKKSDVMVIIGGKNSSNTKQLFNISKEICKDSYLVENENEIKKEWFINKNHCGVSAGASTPQWLIEKIIQKIKEENE